METIFAGDLSFFCNEDHLQSLFSTFGSVKSAIIRRGKGGENLQYGFIQMANADARKAVATLNGTKFMGRKLRLNIAEHANDRSIPPNRGELVKVLVSFVSHTNRNYVSEEVLDGIFSAYGEVEDCTIKHYAISTDTPGKHSGYGFVYFLDINAALKAIQDIKEELQGHVQGLVLDCHLSHDSAKRMHQSEVDSHVESSDISGQNENSSSSSLKVDTSDSSGANAAKINHYAGFFKPSSANSNTVSSHAHKVGSPSSHLRKSSSSMLNKSQSSHSIVSSMSSLSTSYPSTPISRSTSGKHAQTIHPAFATPVIHSGATFPSPMVSNNTVVLQPVPMFPPQLSTQQPMFASIPASQPMHYFQPSSSQVLPPQQVQFQVAAEGASNPVFVHHSVPTNTTVGAPSANYYPPPTFMANYPGVHDNSIHNIQHSPYPSQPTATHNSMMMVQTMMMHPANNPQNYHIPPSQTHLASQVSSTSNAAMAVYPPPPASYQNVPHHPAYPSANTHYSPMEPQPYSAAPFHQSHHVATMSVSGNSHLEENQKNIPHGGVYVSYPQNNDNYPSYYGPSQNH